MVKVQGKKSGKKLENILDTGETFENSKEYKQLLLKKANLSNLIEIKENQQEDLKERLLLSQKRYEKLLNDFEKYDTDNTDEEKSKNVKMQIHELSEDLKRRKIMYDKKIKQLKKSLFNITSSLRQYKQTEAELEDKFNRMNQELTIQHSNLKTIKSLESFRTSPHLDASELSPVSKTSRFGKIKNLLVFS